MTRQEIAQMAYNFRRAIESAQMAGDLDEESPFNRFPHGCCDDVSDLFGLLLIAHGESIFRVCGQYRYDDWEHRYSHAWLELENGIVIDLTGDQYKDNPILLNYDIPCYVGKRNALHNLFVQSDFARNPFFGIEEYHEVAQRRLHKVSKIIMQYM